jgi:hypothetical protein
MITNPHHVLFNESNIETNYQNIKKVTEFKTYSSDQVDKLTIDELKTIIKNSELLED